MSPARRARRARLERTLVVLAVLLLLIGGGFVELRPGRAVVFLLLALPVLAWLAVLHSHRRYS